MGLSLQQLLTPTTRDEARDAALDFLDELGFSATSWQSGSVQRTIVTGCAWLFADATQAVAKIAAGGYNATAEGDWLDLVGVDWYDNERVEATETEGEFEMVSAVGSPLHNFAEEDLLFSDREGGEPHPDGRAAQLYRNVEAGSIAAGETKSISVVAARPGSAGNIPSDQTIYLLTPLSGVTVSNPADPSTLTWITTPGTDRESDDRYRKRNPAKWSTLSYGSPPLAYERWTFEADESVNRVAVTEDGAGGVTVSAATAVGGITANQITTIKNYIEAGRRPINDVVTVQSTATKTISIVAAPSIKRGSGTTAATITSTVTAYLGALPIGGAIVPPSSVGAVIRDEIIERVMALPGVLRFGLSSPSGDVALSPGEIAVASYSIAITWVD